MFSSDSIADVKQSFTLEHTGRLQLSGSVACLQGLSMWQDRSIASS